MKALVYTANQEMTYRDEPAPLPVAGEALVAIDSVGICGSDMHAYLGHDPRRVPPLILGHEAVGTVLEGARAGESVVLNPLITCGVCDACLGGRQNLCAKRDLIGMFRAGAFAEQIAIPERNLIAVPNGMDAHKAALTEPGATALHAVSLAEKTLSRPVSEARALVIGGGSVGLLTALFLLDKGASEVHLAETNPLRRATAEAGAVTGVNANIEPRRAHVFDPITAAAGRRQLRRNFRRRRQRANPKHRDKIGAPRRGHRAHRLGGRRRRIGRAPPDLTRNHLHRLLHLHPNRPATNPRQTRRRRLGRIGLVGTTPAINRRRRLQRTVSRRMRSGENCFAGLIGASLRMRVSEVRNLRRA